MVLALASNENPLRSSAMHLLAYQHERAGDFQSAHRVLDELMQRDIGLSDTFNSLLHKTYLYRAEGRYESAEAILNSLENSYGLSSTQTRSLILARRALNDVSELHREGLVSSPDASTPDTKETQQVETSNTLIAVAYPNPFNPVTTIRYNLPEAGLVTLRLFNVLGQEVALLVNNNQGAGQHEVTFIADNLPSGLYLYRLEALGQSQMGTIQLLK